MLLTKMNISRSWKLVILDVLLTIGAFFISLVLRFEVDAIKYFLQPMIPVMIAAAVVRPSILYVTGIYRRVWRYATTRDFFQLGLAIFLGSILIAIVAFSLFTLSPQYVSTLPRSVLVIEMVISFILIGGSRVLIHQIERYPGDILWRKVKLEPARKVLIVGAGSAGVQMLRELNTNPQLGLAATGFLDDDDKKIGQRIHGIPVFGPIINLNKVSHEIGAEAVIIAIPSAAQQTIQNIKSMCHEAQLPYSTMPPISSFLKIEEAPPSSLLKLPMSLPDITGEEIEAVVRVMQSRNLSIGSQTMAFEKYAAGVANAEHAIAVSNGTAALHMSVIAAGIGPGDEVITSTFSFVSSANCILYERAKPVFIDIDPVSLNLDPAKLEAAITKHTKAIIPVHIFGQPADMDPILKIAEKYNLIVIEDACEAIGAEYKGQRVGAMGKAGAFAFYPNKQMTTGEGAVIVTNDEHWAELFRSLRNQGRDVFDGWLNHSRLGYNYRISEMNAAVGVVQIRRLENLLEKREDVAAEYKKNLDKIDKVSPLTIVPTTTRMSWFVYPVRFDENIDRNLVLDKLAEKGIPARPYFTPIHLQPFYRERFGYKVGDFPLAEAAGTSILALPFYASMKPEEVQVVCDNLAEVLAQLS